jgi:hypothetical protein
LLLASHEYVPWWITAPLAGYVVQWHSSLQHEAIHGMRGIPKAMRRALVWAPIGVWCPFEIYRRQHAKHHRNRYVTYPGEDPETYYIEEEAWKKHGDIWRRLLTVNQTFSGRLLIGPLLQMPRLFIDEAGRMIAGDMANAGIWFRHCIGSALVLLLVTQVFEMSIWSYLVEFSYSSFVFGMMRSFTEHRWSERASERTAVVESNWVFGLLFLWNNLHAVHHLFPTCHGGNCPMSGAGIVSASKRTTAASCFEVTARSHVDGSPRRISSRSTRPAAPVRIQCPMRLCSIPALRRSRASRCVRMRRDAARPSRRTASLPMYCLPDGRRQRRPLDGLAARALRQGRRNRRYRVPHRRMCGFGGPRAGGILHPDLRLSAVQALPR